MTDAQKPFPDPEEQAALEARLRPTAGFLLTFTVIELAFCMLFDKSSRYASALSFLVNSWIVSGIIFLVFTAYLRASTGVAWRRTVPRAAVMALGMVAGDVIFAFMAFR